MLFRHKNNTDIAVEILKAFFIKEKRAYSFKVQWVCLKPSGRKDIYVGGFPLKQRLEIPMKVWSTDWGPIILEEGETWRDYYYQKIKGPCARKSAETFEAFQQVAKGTQGTFEGEPALCGLRKQEEGGSAPHSSVSHCTGTGTRSNEPDQPL